MGPTNDQQENDSDTSHEREIYDLDDDKLSDLEWDNYDDNKDLTFKSNTPCTEWRGGEDWIDEILDIKFDDDVPCRCENDEVYLESW